jgi:hypothetical protein
MDLTAFTSMDLSGESTKALQDLSTHITKELEARGGFEGTLFTFIKKKVREKD